MRARAGTTHAVLSGQLVKDIDTLVGSGKRSVFITQAAEKELMQGAAKHIEKLRRPRETRDHPHHRQPEALSDEGTEPLSPA